VNRDDLQQTGGRRGATGLCADRSSHEQFGRTTPILATRLPAAWALALMAIAAVQLAGAVLGMGSFTRPGDLAVRTGVGLAAEMVMFIVSATYLRSRSKT
jgi:hypothetical protein